MLSERQRPGHGLAIRKVSIGKCGEGCVYGFVFYVHIHVCAVFLLFIVCHVFFSHRKFPPLCNGCHHKAIPPLITAVWSSPRPYWPYLMAYPVVNPGQNTAGQLEFFLRVCLWSLRALKLFGDGLRSNVTYSDLLSLLEEFGE